MKILELRFKNLNSLYGEWIIDLTEPEYISNGIFALTGPTGAGKSTILDAICLALYGATPRLGKITKNSNEIMSRQTGECYAEVLFASQAGRFRCHWEQHRAKKSPDGNLQDQEHQISDTDTNKLIETKKSLVKGVIEEKTGMDFERFTRSILLAQGDFDTFLKADIEEKSRILEQITGTEIYSEISKCVHERTRYERDQLNLLENEIASFNILDPEQVNEIEKELAGKQKIVEELNKDINIINQSLIWLKLLESLKNDLRNLEEEEIKIKEVAEVFRPEKERLNKAINASVLDGEYASLMALRKQQSDDEEELKENEELFPELESKSIQLFGELKIAEEQTNKVKEALREIAPIFQKVRYLDQNILSQNNTLSNLINTCNNEKDQILKSKKRLEIEKEHKADAEKDLKQVNDYLQMNANDEWLISGFAGLEEQFVNLLAKQEEILAKENDREKLENNVDAKTNELNENQLRFNKAQQRFEDKNKDLQEGQKALSTLLEGRLLREYRAERDAFLKEMSLRREIEKLNVYRSRLEDGKACPLCGSLSHPYAEGNIPMPNEFQQKIDSLDVLIEKAEIIEKDNKQIEEDKTKLNDRLNNIDKLVAINFEEQKSSQKALSEVIDYIEKLKKEDAIIAQSVLEKLKPYSIDSIPEGQAEALLDSLKTRKRKWQETVIRKTDIENQISDINSEIKRLGAIIETQESEWQKKQGHLEQLKNDILVIQTERHYLFGDKNPDKEEELLTNQILQAEQTEKDARIASSELKEKVSSVKSNITALNKRLELRATKCKKAESDFLTALKAAGFSEETDFSEARMGHDEREALASRSKELERAETELWARRKDLKGRLDIEMKKRITEKTHEDLEIQLTDYEEKLQALADTIASLNYRIKENNAALERLKNKKVFIEAQKKECYRWDKLHELIGSADGKKFRNFAQGLTFELMVSHANRQLQKMTDRYLLKRDDENPLELNVLDNYQAGEIRSTKNLSGGESFIVSLALALGLSKMSSRKVRVDSLFLDEGFGTLDEDALETALVTLSGLQQDGKLIGIISHVPALKERISTQIIVEPLSGGRSQIVGPGCSRK